MRSYFSYVKIFHTLFWVLHAYLFALIKKPAKEKSKRNTFKTISLLRKNLNDNFWFLHFHFDTILSDRFFVDKNLSLRNPSPPSCVFIFIELTSRRQLNVGTRKTVAEFNDLALRRYCIRSFAARLSETHFPLFPFNPFSFLT